MYRKSIALVFFTAAVTRAAGVEPQDVALEAEVFATAPSATEFSPLDQPSNSPASRNATRSGRDGGDSLSSIDFRAVRRPDAAGPATIPVELPAGAVGRREVDVLVRWEAPNQRHLPVYFEDIPAERYGQSLFPPAQPIISGGRFLAQAALLPYQMGVDAPRRVNYDVGLARPGSPTPPVRQRLPYSTRGLIYQGAASTGLALFVHP